VSTMLKAMVFARDFTAVFMKKRRYSETPMAAMIRLIWIMWIQNPLRDANRDMIADSEVYIQDQRCLTQSLEQKGI